LCGLLRPFEYPHPLRKSSEVVLWDASLPWDVPTKVTSHTGSLAERSPSLPSNPPEELRTDKLPNLPLPVAPSLPLVPLPLQTTDISVPTALPTVQRIFPLDLPSLRLPPSLAIRVSHFNAESHLRLQRFLVSCSF